MACLLAACAFAAAGWARGAAPASAPAVRSFTVGSGTLGLDQITAGPGGDLWFTEARGRKIGRITASGAVSQYALTSSAPGPRGIVEGPDGDIWFADYTGGAIGRSTAAGQISEYPVGTVALPLSISTGPDGDLWFTEEAAGAIGRITTSGKVTSFSVGSGSEPAAIAPGPGNTVWFTYAGGIGSLSASGSVHRHTVAGTGSAPPYGIVEGPDGDLWFTLSSSNEIGRMTPSGTLTRFKIPTAGSEPFSIVSGPDGALWFTEISGAKIGRITTGGAITEYAVPGGPEGIAAAGGDIWFTEANANAIGRLVPPPSAGSGPPPPPSVEPVLAKTALATLVSGTVLIKRPGSSSFVRLAATAPIPFGSVVNATHGDVRITTATTHRGHRQSARFYKGRFKLSQKRSGATELRLDAPLGCRRGVRAASAAPKKRTRSLWGNGHGRFTTIGKWASATVLGTVWETIDECNETVVRVLSGEVRVTNTISHQESVIVHGGHSITETPPP